MRFKTTLLAISLASAFSAQAEQIKVNGYFNGIYSYADEQVEHLNTKDGGSLTKDSKIGMKATFIKDNNVSGTTQVSFEENNEGDFEVEFDEGYLRYTLSENQFVEAGKFITPIHIDSNMHNYQQFKPWLIDPLSVYNKTSPTSTTGVSFTQTNKTNIYEISSEIFFGQSTSKQIKTSFSPDTEIKYSSMWGGASKMIGKNHTINLSYIQAKTQFKRANSQSNTNDPSSEKHNYQLASISALYSATDNTILKTEFKSESFDGLLPDNKSYYVNATQYWNQYEASITYGSTKTDSSKPITEIKAGVGYSLTSRAKIYGEYTKFEIEHTKMLNPTTTNQKINKFSIGLLMTF